MLVLQDDLNGMAYLHEVIDCIGNAVNGSSQIGHLMPGLSLFMDDDQSWNLCERLFNFSKTFVK